VWDNIAFGLRATACRSTRSRSASRPCSSSSSWASTRKRKPHQLSGGQQQRVALARSLAKRPQLLLLDEPLGALDKKLREQTQIELVNIIERVGVTCVMVTHDQEEAMTMASRIAIMSEGRFLQVGSPERHLRIAELPLRRRLHRQRQPDGRQLRRRHPTTCHRTRRLPDYVGHGITGTERHGRRGAAARRRSRSRAPAAQAYNQVQGTSRNCRTRQPDGLPRAARGGQR
jgi:putrescine transport system ATP-binding protein